MEISERVGNPGRSRCRCIVLPDLPKRETNVAKQIHMCFRPMLSLTQGITERLEDEPSVRELFFVQSLGQYDTQQSIIDAICFGIQGRREENSDEFSSQPVCGQ